MTEFHFESEKIGDPETVSEFSMEGYEKYRVKSGELTLDIAIVELENRDEEEYIEQRKEELASSKKEVPHPYKPEKQNLDNNENLVKFSDMHGKGYADPEYNLVSEEGDSITRYKYLITWKIFEDRNKLTEIEIYMPKDDLSYQEAADLADSIRLET